MNELSLYLLKSAVGIMVFYTFYWFLLRQETFFQLNRFYLLFSLLASFILPLLNLSFGVAMKGDLATGLLAPLTITTVAPETDYPAFSFSAYDLLAIVYWGGAGFFLARIFLQLFGFAVQWHKFSRIAHDRFAVVVTSKVKSPASFFNILFLSPEDLQSRHLDTIVSHENYHRSQYHSLDMLLVEILTAIQWFNPFVWLFKQALQAQHEYAVDRDMLQKGEDKFQYQSLLFEKGVGIKISDLMSYFNNSLLKTRMKMMDKKQSKARAGLKYFLALPLLVLLTVGLFSEQPVFAQQQVVTDQIDEMPVYPGGDEALYRYISKNIRYPKSARSQRVQGKLFISFVVDKTGKVTDIQADEGKYKQNVMSEIVVVGYQKAEKEADKPANKDLEPIITEAKYVIGELAQFTPGKKDGRNVAVKITIPITFKLDYL